MSKTNSNYVYRLFVFNDDENAYVEKKSGWPLSSLDAAREFGRAIGLTPGVSRAIISRFNWMGEWWHRDFAF